MYVSQERVLEWCSEQTQDVSDFASFEECLNLIPSLDSMADLPAGTRVLVRCDTDVEVKDGQIEEDVRIRSLVETLSYGYQKGWVQIVYGHRGRDPELSLDVAAKHLEGLLKETGLANVQISFIADWMDNNTGRVLDAAAVSVSRLPNGAIVVLENTRKYEMETSLWKTTPEKIQERVVQYTRYVNDMREKFARIHVNEGFASSNRDLSSTLVPLGSDRIALGKYIDRELRQFVTRTRKAELVIFSGMKLNKLDDLEAILEQGRVKMVIAAGLLAMTLKKAEANLDGKEFELGIVGDESNPNKKLRIEKERIAQAERMLMLGRKNGVEFVHPIDFILEDGRAADVIPRNGAQFDVGPKTCEFHASKVQEFIKFHQSKKASGQGAAVAFHNGVFGMFEKEEFSHGTRKFMLQLKVLHEAGVEVYVGGGEGGLALTKYGDESWVTHCFTAGGTILKALGTEPIPYLKALYLRAKCK